MICRLAAFFRQSTLIAGGNGGAPAANLRKNVHYLTLYRRDLLLDGGCVHRRGAGSRSAVGDD